MKVRIVEDAIHHLRRWAEEAAPLETGGILLGVYADGDPWVTHAVLIDDTTRTANRYQLPAGITQDVVKQARRTDGRLGYVGDWHSHPADIGPSATDIGSLRTIARQTLGRGRRPPVMVVVRRRQPGWVLDGRMALRWPFGTKQLEILETGPASIGTIIAQIGPIGSPRPKRSAAPRGPRRR